MGDGCCVFVFVGRTQLKGNNRCKGCAGITAENAVANGLEQINSCWLFFACRPAMLSQRLEQGLKILFVFIVIVVD